MKGFFITATGTGIGKTLITAALAHQLRALALKPVISGFDAQHIAESDASLLLDAQGLPVTPENIDSISPFRFKVPLSPDMAAEDEGRTFDFDALIAFCRKEAAGTVLIEGIGGVMSPLSNRHTVLDWMQALALPAILVTGSYLGSISHTLTACEVIKARGLTLHAIIISESEGSPVTPARMRETLMNFIDARVIIIARLDSSPQMWKHVPDLTTLLA